MPTSGNMAPILYGGRINKTHPVSKVLVLESLAEFHGFMVTKRKLYLQGSGF